MKDIEAFITNVTWQVISIVIVSLFISGCNKPVTPIRGTSKIEQQSVQEPVKKSPGLDRSWIKKQIVLLESYKSGKTTLDEFENDGWNINDTVKGRLGIVGHINIEDASWISVGTNIGLMNFGDLVFDSLYIQQRRLDGFKMKVTETSQPYFKLFFVRGMLVEITKMK